MIPWLYLNKKFYGAIHEGAILQGAIHQALQYYYLFFTFPIPHYSINSAASALWSSFFDFFFFLLPLASDQLFLLLPLFLYDMGGRFFSGLIFIPNSLREYPRLERKSWALSCAPEVTNKSLHPKRYKVLMNSRKKQWLVFLWAKNCKNLERPTDCREVIM